MLMCAVKPRLYRCGMGTEPVPGRASHAAVRAKRFTIGRPVALSIAALSIVVSFTGCSSEGDGAPGAALATGDVESQQAADRILGQSVDDLTYGLPRPASARSATIDAAVPAVLDAWHATVTRELISATGRSSERRLLVKLTVDYVPSNTADWGGEPCPARVTRCFEVSPDPHDEDGPGGVDPDWRAMERACG